MGRLASAGQARGMGALPRRLNRALQGADGKSPVMTSHGRPETKSSVLATLEHLETGSGDGLRPGELAELWQKTSSMPFLECSILAHVFHDWFAITHGVGENRPLNASRELRHRGLDDGIEARQLARNKVIEEGVTYSVFRTVARETLHARR